MSDFPWKSWATAPNPARRSARRLGSIFFLLGFSTVYLLGPAPRLWVSSWPRYAIVTKVAGALIVLFGLHMTGVIHIPVLYYHKRADAGAFKSGYAGSFLMGLAFACGWTPCIGPILSGILALAATRETVGQGMRLLFVYSMGLGIPFILTGFAVGAFMRFFSRYKKYIRAGEVFAGLLLIAVGVLIFSDRLTALIRLMPSGLTRLAM